MYKSLKILDLVLDRIRFFKDNVWFFICSVIYLWIIGFFWMKLEEELKGVFR